MMEKTLIKKIGFNTASQIIGKILSVLLGFISVGILTRYLGASDYGDFTLVFAYLSFFGIIADFGLQLTIVRELSQNNIKASAIYGTYFWLKLSLVILSTLFALIVLLFFPYSAALKMGIIIGALGVGIGGMTGFGTAIFQSNLRLDLVTIIDVSTKIITVAFIVLFVFLKFNFYYIVSTVLIGNFTGFIITALLLKRMIKFDFNFDSSLAKKIITWSIPIGFTSFFSVVYFRLDTIMLSVMKGSYEVGIYGLSYRVFENILMFWGFYMASVYPMLAGFKNDKKNFTDLLKKSTFAAFISSIFLIFAGLILAPLVVNIFGGAEFYPSILSFKILLFSIPFFFLDNLFYTLFLIERKIKIILFGMGLTLLINFFLNLIFIPVNGYIAASYITVLSEIILFLFYLIAIFRLKFCIPIASRNE